MPSSLYRDFNKRMYTFSFCSVSLTVLAATYLTHLKLKEAPLLLHLLCYLGPADLRPDHSVLSGVLLFLLLNLGAARSTKWLLKTWTLHTHTRAHLHHYVSYRCSNSTSVLLYGHSISFIKRKAKKSQDSRVSINDGVRAFYFRQGNHWIYLFIYFKISLFWSAWWWIQSLYRTAPCVHIRTLNHTQVCHHAGCNVPCQKNSSIPLFSVWMQFRYSSMWIHTY